MDAVEYGRDQRFAATRLCIAFALQEVGQRDSTGIRHADHRPRKDAVKRIDWHDIGVLKHRHVLRFGKRLIDDLQNHITVCQVVLCRQEDLAESTSAEFVDQPKANRLQCRLECFIHLLGAPRGKNLPVLSGQVAEPTFLVDPREAVPPGG